MPRSILLYGESGTYKTTQIGFLARYVWDKHKKITRLISSDTGGYFPLSPLIDQGIIDVCDVNLMVGNDKSVLALLRKLSRGFWIKDGKMQPGELTNVGCYAIESLSSLSDLIMYELRRDLRAAAEPTVTPFAVAGDAAFGSEERFGCNSRAHYGFTQREIQNFVRAMCGIAVPYVIFTTHETYGEDDVSRQRVRGPSIVGQAVTSRVPAWFGDCLHSDAYWRSVPSQDKLQRHELTVRIWFTRHPDETVPGITYPAKVRVPPAGMKALLDRWPGGFFVPTLEHGLDEFVEFTDALAEKHTF